MKTNREMNQEHEARELMRVRPKTVEYRFDELQAVMNTWTKPSQKKVTDE